MAAELVGAANSRPLLSGFYKMLTTVIRIADQAGLLQPASAMAPAEDQICHQVLLRQLFLQGGQLMTDRLAWSDSTGLRSRSSDLCQCGYL